MIILKEIKQHKNNYINSTQNEWHPIDFRVFLCYNNYVLIPNNLYAGGYNMQCQLSTLMGQSRYSIQDVHNKTGLARSTITQLYHDKATRIDFETIEKLCVLFQCDINELLKLEGIKTKR